MTASHNSNDALNALFEADSYLLFHDSITPPARRAQEVAFIVRELGLDKSMSLLDLACGHGRHANLLANEVREVVAIDRNVRFLELARYEAERLGVQNVNYCERDVREIMFEATFDRIILANTVFGLFSDSENAKLLGKVAKALRSGGYVCLDVVNRDTILAGFNPHGVTEVNGAYMIERLSFDPHTGRMSNDRVYFREGRAIKAPFSLRLYNYTEMASILTHAGLRIIAARADWTGGDFNAFSKRIMLIAEKAG
jgi:ubiquinone/menaquinone biosynthesis C-methylase UbiE